MTPSTRALATLGALILLATPAAAQEPGGTHEVREGDTLWDLAGSYLADPYRWSEIFELNPEVVEDPHWIFPGETLRLPGLPEGTIIDRMSPESLTKRVELPERGDEDEPADAGVMGEGPPAERARRIQDAPGSGEFPESSVFRQPRASRVTSSLSLADVEPRPAVSPSDFYSAPVLGDRTTLAAAGITSRVVEENPLRMRLPTSARPHDEIIVALAGLGVEVGDDLLAVRWGRRIDEAGYVLHSMAYLQVTRLAGDSARAKVLRIFDDYQVGDPVMLVEPFPLEPGVEPEPEAAGPVGIVLGFAVDQVLVGRGEKLFINLGEVDGVQPGDEFAVFSAGEATPSEALFEDRLSVVRVLRTTESTATAMVIDIRDPGMQPGSPVRRVKRMPPPPAP